MKTTVDLNDALLNRAKRIATQRQTTLRALIEDGLRRVVDDQPRTAKTAFKLRDASVKGGTALLSDPREWRELEDAHLASLISKAPTTKKR
jgi:predicted transcriptional regulator